MTVHELVEKLKIPKFFIERFFWIVDKDRQRVPFKFNLPQQKFYENHSNNDLILKARKEGFSSLIEAMWLHACMFRENENVVTMAHTEADTKIHLDRVRDYMTNMGLQDQPMQVEVDTDNQREIYFPRTNSRYWIGTAGAKAFGRGRDITRLHLSEVAHYSDPAVITGVMEACVPNAWKVLETTANGVGEMFHKLWKESSDPQSGSPWKRHFFAWFEDPSNRIAVPQNITVRLTSSEEKMKRTYTLDLGQILWYRKKRAEMVEKEKMPQEYPSNDQEAFLSSGRHCFNIQKLADKKAQVTAPQYVGDVADDGDKLRFVANPEGTLKVWKMPRTGRSYLISADSGEGVPEGDYSVAQVLDRSSWEQVAVWRARIDPGAFGRVLVDLGNWFNTAILAPELNNHGWATIEAIKTMKYPHLLNTKQLWNEHETQRDGFPTNDKTRNLIITATRNAVDDDTVFIHDNVTLEEMESFVQNERTGKFEAQLGSHDDCVISLGIGIYCLKFLTVDESYGRHSEHKRTSPILTTSVVGSGYRRHSATGYR
jgi:hypothetical protein